MTVTACSAAPGATQTRGDHTPESDRSAPPPATRVSAADRADLAHYPDHARLTAMVAEIARAHPERVHLEPIARTREDRPIWALRLAGPGPIEPDRRTAVLIVAGLDPTRPAGTVIALDIARRLATEEPRATTTQADDPEDQRPDTSTTRPATGTLLSDHTVYIVPRVNADGVERFLRGPREDGELNGRPTDDDRDGAADDDPPDDLNGDGLITMMRVPDLEATHLADADEPRLMHKADRSKNERPTYRVYVEGIDNDGDGEYNEDGVGGVDLNRNFMHAYPELQAGAGPHHVSEPETRGLADFVIAHPNICAVIVYGRHDNLINVPGDKARDVSGRGYRHLHPGDTPIYKHISERYKELTELTGAPKNDNAGSFFGWTYNHLGLPTFATTAWWIPKKAKADDEKPDKAATQPATRPSDDADEAEPAATQPATAPADPSASTKPIKDKDKDKDGDTKKKKKPDKKDPLETDRKWLEYSDERRDGEGYVDWTPFDHPQLGKVEIGGWVPGFRENPPADAIDGIVDRQLAFLADIADRLPAPRVAGCEVTRRGDALWEIELAMTNDGYFPTALAMAQTARTAKPFVLRLDLPAEDIMGGQRVHRIGFLEGLGATGKVRWLVRGDRGRTVKAIIYHKRYGTIEYDIALEPTDEEADR